jgi:hypothetical protein
MPFDSERSGYEAKLSLSGTVQKILSACAERITIERAAGAAAQWYLHVSCICSFGMDGA